MELKRCVTEPLRKDLSINELWHGTDNGLIACWERGREVSSEVPELATRARMGQLVPLPWKGGVEKVIKTKSKMGTLRYLAMWQGLRGEPLDIDTTDEPTFQCSKFKVSVTFTNDPSKYADA
ncbi:hypothetical protein CR155_05790 [Pollutimonas nitritireducens]|uniref:Uncharacterized protein n=1 Tax=Pollutimonas nitritireducens TaxID=2045209 RepID=A0A2N4UIW1_9BURK|nr:hypothetical protein CR155_05790 [Pollutimonas nitritireducens]